MTDKKKVSTAMPTVDEEDYRKDLTPKKTKKLKIDTEGYRPSKTRAELYRELESQEQKLDEDVFEYAAPVSRALALVIDVAFIFSVVIVALQVAPYEFAVAKHFLDLYKMQFIFTTDTIIQFLDVVNVIIAVFFSLLIPLAFFNTSFGKKIFKLRVRGEEYYTISLTKAFQRELIFKPLSIALIAGLVMPFVTKNKQSLHDRMADTIVIKD